MPDRSYKEGFEEGFKVGWNAAQEQINRYLPSSRNVANCNVCEQGRYMCEMEDCPNK